MVIEFSTSIQTRLTAYIRKTPDEPWRALTEDKTYNRSMDCTSLVRLVAETLYGMMKYHIHMYSSHVHHVRL
jgi:hypothetical protein